MVEVGRLPVQFGEEIRAARGADRPTLARPMFGDVKDRRGQFNLMCLIWLDMAGLMADDYPNESS